VIKSQLFFGDTRKESGKKSGKDKFFQGKIYFFTEEKPWQSQPTFSKLAVHFPSGIPDEISRDLGLGIPDQN